MKHLQPGSLKQDLSPRIGAVGKGVPVFVPTLAQCRNSIAELDGMLLEHIMAQIQEIFTDLKI